jgi:hypothetical protein
MYTIIPTRELINIIKGILDRNNNTSDKQKQEIMTLAHTIIDQNYLQFNNQYYKQDNGLAMGAPTSAILTEIFIQHLEHIKIINILKQYHIIDYCRYVDDRLIVYNEDIKNIENTLIDFHSVHPNIQFTIEKETHNSLNYLDLTITNEHNKLTFSIFRKPTPTDLIIHNDSCHPQEHKYAAIHYLTNRMNTYPITESSKNHEQQQIKTILYNSNYPTHRHKRKSKSGHCAQDTPFGNKQKWATFTYIGKETRVITKLFKNTNIRISFRTKNTIKNHLKTKKHIPNIYDESGIYQLKCSSCPLKYVGQTDRNFHTRFKEHIQAIRTNKQSSTFAQHILDTQHT